MCSSVSTTGHTYADRPNSEYVDGTGMRRVWQDCTGCGNVTTRPVRFAVMVTVKSPASEPVELPYYRGDSHVAALAALMTAATEDPADHNMPESIRTRVLSVRLDIAH